MKYLIPLTLVLLFSTLSSGQARTISKEEYDRVFKFAVSETNAAFPFLFTVVTTTFEGEKATSTETMVNERHDAGVERIKTPLATNDSTKTVHQLRIGFRNVYCSEDGKIWTGPGKYECPHPSGVRRIYGPRQPESSEYTVKESVLDGKSVKIYREYLVFASFKDPEKKDFREKTATVDSRGFFLSIFGSEGTLGPRSVTLTRKQTWKMNVKFDPISAPK